MRRVDGTARAGRKRIWICFALPGVFATAIALSAGGEMCRLRDAQGADPSAIVVATPRPGGPPLVVSGTVYAPDGETPAPGVTLYVYQTDETGRYAPPGVDVPRLRGWMTTDGEGRYEYRTIRPAPYPGGRQAAHVHTQLWGNGYSPQWGSTLEFADDPLLPERERASSAAAGRFAWVCAPTVETDGAQRCRHDLRLSERGDSFEENTRHGFHR